VGTTVNKRNCNSLLYPGLVQVALRLFVLFI
jgi:hypothetical protein